MSRARRGVAALAVAALGLGAAACGSDARSADASAGASGSSTSGASGASDGSDAWSSGYADPARTARTIHVAPSSSKDLPPLSMQGLSAIYADPFAAIGLRLTRASVIQLDTGPHLQLYVEPIGTATNADYVERIASTAKLVAPDAFATWSELATFDMCQEPPPGIDDRVVPEPETVLFMTRAQVAAVDWTTVTTTDLRRVIAATDGGELRASPAIAADPAWIATNP